MLKSMKSPIKYVSPWLIAMLFINLILSLLVIPAPTLAQESETNANLVGVFSFGMGNHGKLGHGDTDRQYTPKKIESLTDIQAIAAADNHSLALTKSGDVYSFGHGYHGELGHGDREDQLTPKKIEGLADIQAIAGGWYHSLALTKSGDVYSFGSGTFGQLGHGDTETQLTPKKIEGLSDIQAIAAGVYHSLALTKSGDVYSFGFGTHGQLGRTEDQLTPKKIEGLSDIQAIAAGGHYSLALTKSGEVYSFGSGTFGQLGHGDTETQFTPKKIEGLSDIQAIAAGSTHSLALTKSGEVYSFGKGTHGQLGHGDREDQLTPKKIESLTDIQAIAAGYYHSLALTKSGDVYSFGGGNYGQLGHGDTDRQYTPKKIESLTDIQAIAAGSTHSLALIIEATQDSTIYPDEASFDKNILKQQAILVTMELNGNTLIDVRNGTTSLSEGADYIVNGTIVTITKEYLVNLPIGTTTLVFMFSAGNDATLSITVSDSTLVPPTDLLATEGDGKVVLSWTASDAVDGYNVYMQEAKEGMPPVVDRWMLDNDEGPVTGTSYTVDHLTAGKWYWFAVTTVKDEMESGFSEATSETPYTTVAAVASPGAIEVGKGVAPEKLAAYLPEHVQIQLTSLPVTMDAGVQWDLEHADYNPDQAGVYAVTGELQLPGYVRNPQRLQAEMAVHVRPNTNARLSGITLNGEPLAPFDPDIYTYDVSVPYATEQVIVTAATDDPAAHYEVVGEVVYGGVQPLKVGLNRMDILVKAEDPQEQAVYTLYVQRQPDGEAPQWRAGDELTVSDITPTSVKLSWPSATDNVGVAGYRIDVDVDNWMPQTVTASVYEFTVTSLRAGMTYTFTVKAFDDAGNESAPLSKQATTARAAGGDVGSSGDSGSGRVLSSNADLADLQVWAGGKQLKLSPSFATGTTEYTACTEAERIEIVIKEAHSAAKVIWKNKVITDGIQFDLEEGDNTIVLTVEAENGTKKTYTLTIYREIYREMPKPIEPVIKFTDIAGHWAESDIKRATAKWIVSGYPDFTFKPNNPVTRAEFTVMLAGVRKLEGDGSVLTFTDHDQIGAWAKQAVAQAVQAGIVVGYSDGSFRPNTRITRAEMAVMIARALQLELNANALPGFADDETIPGWAKGAVEAIRKLGIVDGRSDNRFVPNETATRAEATVMLLRLLDR
ncbi:RCC1 domain-containing protein [Paenibacillus sp. FSL R5-0810]|uniref:RCC1 domain-containing protein n=1 Tax=Paenibacillus sp. FSL R5-0810 TaxID=2921659 RepID=UPI0030F4CE7B